jgi:hypothetical protein
VLEKAGVVITPEMDMDPMGMAISGLPLTVDKERIKKHWTGMKRKSWVLIYSGRGTFRLPRY